MITFSRAKQLASLTAAGASAIALTGAKAEASIIASPVLNISVGFSADQTVSANNNFTAAMHAFNTFAATGLNFAVKARSGAFSNGSDNHSAGFLFSAFRDVYARGHAGPVTSGTLWDNNRVAKGQSWNIGLGIFLGELGSRSWGRNTTGINGTLVTHSSTHGLPSVEDAYLLFEFPVGPSSFDFGWLEFSLQVTNNFGGPAGDPQYLAPHLDGPNATIVQYAFQNTPDTPIPAGDTGVPEPATIAESGLAALVLGAEGLRRWRKARKAA